LLFAQYGEYSKNNDIEPETLIGIAIAAGINLLIFWGIINHATRADRALKAQLTIIAYLEKLAADKGLPKVTNYDLTVINKHLKSIELDVEYPKPVEEESK
jgi:cytochrome b